MTKALEVKKVSDNEAFYCATCERYFSSLDAQALVENYQFKCMFCKSELQECTHKSDENGLDLKEVLNALNGIIVLLKAAEKYEIPSMDYFQVLEIKKDRETSKDKITDEIEKNAREKERKFLNIEKDANMAEFDEFASFPVGETAKKSIQETDEAISVNGILKRFSEITEEDKELMNEDEYTKYFEIYSLHND